jgi:hypothetical protein
VLKDNEEKETQEFRNRFGSPLVLRQGRSQTKLELLTVQAIL